MVTKSILLAVAWLTENDGHCFANVDTIAQYAFCDRVSAYALLRRLREQGIIIQHGSYKTKSYFIDIKKIKLISQPYATAKKDKRQR